jgi:hypothetical protein
VLVLGDELLLSLRDSSKGIAEMRLGYSVELGVNGQFNECK